MLLAALVVAIGVAGSRAAAAQVAGPPLIPPAEIKGRTGAFCFAGSEHDQRTTHLGDVAKRLGLKPADASAAEYDAAKQTFFVYVPKAPAGDGKYGLMAGLCFKDLSAPPDAWPDVLERHHLIWVAALGSDDAKPAVQRVALLLDAVHLARKAWNVDGDRVYLSMNTPTGPAAGTAFYYPEVFDGMIQTPGAEWFTKLRGFERPPLTWGDDKLPRPQPSDLTRARAHSRFFIVARDDGDKAVDPAGKSDPLAGNATLRRVVRHGYQQTGFKSIGAAVVPESAMAHYVGYAADWFEQGVTFLDAPLEAQRRKPAAPTGRAAPARPSDSPVGPIRLPGAGQVPSPGGFGF